jgi:hypothetical protein
MLNYQRVSLFYHFSWGRNIQTFGTTQSDLGRFFVNAADQATKILQIGIVDSQSQFLFFLKLSN